MLFKQPACIAILFALPAALWLHKVDDTVITLKAPDANDSLVPSYRSVELCSGGFERFLSDIFWLGFVQYCGESHKDRKEIAYRRSYEYVNLISQLDPYFKQPYWFGCWTIGYWQARPDLADKIMQRGIFYNPKDWYMSYLAGVNQFMFARNTKLAARYYRQAARLPDAPADFLDRQATLFESSIPEYEKRFRTLWHLYWTSKEANLKQSTYGELVRTLKEIYRNSPGNAPTVKRGAHDRLLELGLSEAEIDGP